jgi:hypothetical protein
MLEENPPWDESVPEFFDGETTTKIALASLQRDLEQALSDARALLSFPSSRKRHVRILGRVMAVPDWSGDGGSYTFLKRLREFVRWVTKVVQGISSEQLSAIVPQRNIEQWRELFAVLYCARLLEEEGWRGVIEEVAGDGGS